MTDQLTRRELLKRGAAGSALLTVPGLLAACGGKAKSSSAGKSAHKLAKTLHFSNWTLYMDTNKKKHIFPSLVEF
ncbi:MAG: spermidine/putrescine ABC transporter substrate-binding protein, partial [Actinobacteria bacterium]